MAHYLQFNGTSEHLEIPAITVDWGSGSGYLEFKVTPANVSNQDFFLGKSSWGEELFFDSGVLKLRLVDGTKNLTSALTANQTYTFRLEYSNSSLTTLVDGVPDKTVSTAGSSSTFTYIARRYDSQHRYQGDLYYLNFNGTRYYDPSASVGQGVLVDTVGGSNGTPVNFSDFEAALIYYDDGSGGTAQTITVISSEELHQAATLSVSSASQVSSIAAEQTENASLLDVFTSQLATNIQAQQVESALPLNANQSLTVQAVPSQETHSANTLSIQQSAGQAVSSIAAEQLEQAAALNLVQQQTLAAIVAEQISDADITNVQSLQAVTMAVAQESHQASTVDIQQYNGQLVTLIVAQQENQAQTLLISEVSAVDLLQASQTESAEVVAFTQTQRITQITAEQLTEAQIISIISAGDNTDLTGLRLTPVTQKYSITPVYTNQYSIQKV